jgi:hypothetical protein
LVQKPLHIANPSHPSILIVHLPYGSWARGSFRDCTTFVQLRFHPESSVSTIVHSTTVAYSVLSISNYHHNVGVFPRLHLTIVRYSTQSVSLRQLNSSNAGACVCRAIVSQLLPIVTTFWFATIVFSIETVANWFDIWALPKLFLFVRR